MITTIVVGFARAASNDPVMGTHRSGPPFGNCRPTGVTANQWLNLHPAGSMAKANGFCVAAAAVPRKIGHSLAVSPTPRESAGDGDGGRDVTTKQP